MAEETLSDAFVMRACEFLAATHSGLSGAELAQIMSDYAAQYGVTIPFRSHPNDAPNKRTALYQNISATEKALP